MKLDDCFELGYIVKTHGVKGQVVALFDVDYPEDYEELESVFLLMAGKLVPFFIERIEPQAGGKFILKFEDLNTIAEAEKLKSTTLYLPLSELPELDEDQFYFHETVGYQVIDENLGELGTVKEFYEMPNQDLMAMEYQGHEILIPVADDIVLRTDKVARKIFVKLPDGLMEVYTQPTNRHEEEYDGDEDYSDEK
ncbi:16S rRNA processing protein RimM [Adhaeribacter sp. BT258]|uniref:Ribosome maturation factor RimM n=1 Tax=Adhaeribacter terrigena TaxID=2793070 RepID=A0ABS1BXQ8_9BACT|nr:ribosome maturation factor RimM [Adhaeribacter terrigena]MBK0401937.1 16S rRNA processing protein RimM [Adhaeribacter terrigena]